MIDRAGRVAMVDLPSATIGPVTFISARISGMIRLLD